MFYNIGIVWIHPIKSLMCRWYIIFLLYAMLGHNRNNPLEVLVNPSKHILILPKLLFNFLNQCLIWMRNYLQISRFFCSPQIELLHLLYFTKGLGNNLLILYFGPNSCFVHLNITFFIGIKMTWIGRKMISLWICSSQFSKYTNNIPVANGSSLVEKNWFFSTSINPCTML